MKAIIATLVVLSAVGCARREEPVKITFATLEDARAMARTNAEFNAANYRMENPRMEGLKIVGHGDSTQTLECPQGDGWASLSIMNVNKDAPKGQQVEKYKVKCSTVSATLGCYLESDFQSKPFAKQENRCDTTLPFPLPKLGK